MARKPPKIDHVKHVLRRGKWYSYFNTGQKKDGQPIRRPLPEWGSESFWASYAGFVAGRTKRAVTEYTVTHLADEYLSTNRFAELAEATRKNYRVQCRKIKEVWGKFPVNHLEPHHVRAVLEREEWGAGTRNMVVATLGVLYRWGRKNNRAKVDPVKDVDRAKGGEHQPWPENVLEAALKSPDDTIRLAVHLLYFTGQRIGDACKMRWGDIREGHIYVRQTKTGKVVEPPLLNELQAELERHTKTLGPILTIAEGRLRRKLQAFTAGMGVKTVPHGLRKNAVNVLLEAGCTIAEVGSITGQTNAIVEKYAAQVNRRKLGKSAIVKLEAYRQK